MEELRRTSNHVLVAALGAILALALFQLGAVTGAMIEASLLGSAVSRWGVAAASMGPESTQSFNASPKSAEPTPSAGSPPS